MHYISFSIGDTIQNRNPVLFEKPKKNLLGNSDTIQYVSFSQNIWIIYS